MRAFFAVLALVICAGVAAQTFNGPATMQYGSTPNTAGDCVEIGSGSGGYIKDAGAPCGSGSGGSITLTSPNSTLTITGSGSASLTADIETQPAFTWLANLTGSMAEPVEVPLYNFFTVVNLSGHVYAASGSNISSLSGCPVTIDGVSVPCSETILLAGQTTQSANGLYVVSSSTWSRHQDLPNGPTLGISCDIGVTVSNGNTYQGHFLRLQTTSAITIGTTNQVWQDKSAVGSDSNRGQAYVAFPSGLLNNAPSVPFIQQTQTAYGNNVPSGANEASYYPCVSSGPSLASSGYVSYTGATVRGTMGIGDFGSGVIGSYDWATYGGCVTHDANDWPSTIGQAINGLPTVASCGSPAPSVVNNFPWEVSSDQSFHVSSIASGTTSCVVTFYLPKYQDSPPVCTGTTQTGAFVGTSTVSGASQSVNTTTTGTNAVPLDFTGGAVTINVASTTGIVANTATVPGTWSAASIIIFDQADTAVLFGVQSKTTTSVTGIVLFNSESATSYSSGTTVNLYGYWNSVTLAFPSGTTDVRVHCT